MKHTFRFLFCLQKKKKKLRNINKVFSCYVARIFLHGYTLHVCKYIHTYICMYVCMYMKNIISLFFGEQYRADKHLLCLIQIYIYIIPEDNSKSFLVCWINT